MKNLSIYIHWPFCAAKCPYCDFNSRPLSSDLDELRWQEAYVRELTYYAERLPDREVTTIYFGGGTPSLMKPSTIAAILNKIASLWKVQQFCEMTLEANPSSSEIGKFQGLKAAGVNRLSLGVQALNDADLKFLGRIHDKNAAREAIEMAQKTFDRFSFDLIYARKDQTAAAWENELQHALSFGAAHMSLYQLTIEEGTVFHKRTRHEQLTVSENEAAILFEMTQEIMAMAGLPAYEISNYAREGQESRHNLTYWRYDDYIGIGPGAHGRFVSESQRYATANYRRPEEWLEQTQRHGFGAEETERLDLPTAQREALMMGLRLIKGIDCASWRKKFGEDVGQFMPASKKESLIQEKLLEEMDHAFRLTSKGRQCLDSVLAYLLS